MFNEKESCFKIVEMFCWLVCGVIVLNDLDKFYEVLVKVIEKQGLYDIFLLIIVYKNVLIKNLKI